MLSQLEQACKTYSTESSSGLIEFDSNWQGIFVTALTFLLDQAIYKCTVFNKEPSAGRHYRKAIIVKMVLIKKFRIRSVK